jgi:hypothetical protein
MTERLLLASLLGFLVFLDLGGSCVLAAPPPAYFGDESTLPFEERA